MHTFFSSHAGGMTKIDKKLQNSLPGNKFEIVNSSLKVAHNKHSCVVLTILRL